MFRRNDHEKNISNHQCHFFNEIAPYNVYAQEVYGDGSASATVTYHVPGEYVVLIPEILSADGTHYTISASVMEL